jgi:acyl-CoA reductase-like NAD-dependent aldehyde dehydrogenase
LKTLDYIHGGIQSGAKLLTGGKRLGDVGYYVEPTIFINVLDDMIIAKEEIFGPVLCIFSFDSEHEVNINIAIKIIILLLIRLLEGYYSR